MFTFDPNFIPIYLAVLTAAFSAVAFFFKWKLGLIPKPTNEDNEEVTEQKDRRKMPKLIYHPVFNEMDELESYFATRYRHPDLGRQTLASEMMVHKIRIWRPLMLEFAERIDKCCESCNLSKPECNKVLNLAVDLLITGMEQYINWHKQDVVVSIDGNKTYSKTDKETMNIYIEKFKLWHASREELVRMITHEAGTSNLYDNCYQKAYLILQGYHLAFSLAKIDAEKSLRSLNGTLTGKIFFGIKITDEGVTHEQ